MDVWIAFLTGSVITFFACAFIFGLLNIGKKPVSRPDMSSAGHLPAGNQHPATGP